MTAEDMKIAIGERVAATRKLHRISQAALARRSGIAASHVSRIERGHAEPALGTLVRIAEALQVSLDDLVPDSAKRAARHHPCPVSPSGRCLVDLIRANSHTASAEAFEAFSPHQVRMLRRFAEWLLAADTDAESAVATLLGERPSRQQRRRSG